MPEGFERAQRKRIVQLLLVEDDDADARIFEKIGEMVPTLDLRVTRVRDIADAQRALRQTRFDVCMLDFWLGSGSSARLMCMLDNRRDVPVVLLSHALPAEIRRMGVLGKDTAFLSKGDCSPERLEAIVSAAVTRVGRTSLRSPVEFRAAG